MSDFGLKMPPNGEATGVPKSMKTSRRSRLRRQSVSWTPRAPKKAVRAPPGHQKRDQTTLLDAKTYIKTSSVDASYLQPSGYRMHLGQR